MGDIEVDDNSGYIDEGGDKGAGSETWIESESFEEQGQHGADQGAPQADGGDTLGDDKSQYPMVDGAEHALGGGSGPEKADGPQRAP